MLNSVFVVVCLVSQAAPIYTPYKQVDRDFMKVYAADTENQKKQTSEQYIDWVHTFYEGSTFTKGWNDRVKDALGRISSTSKARVNYELDVLGFLIGAEWSKDNSVRRIDTAFLRSAGPTIENAASNDTGDGKTLLAEVAKVRSKVDKALSTGPKVAIPKSLDKKP